MSGDVLTREDLKRILKLLDNCYLEYEDQLITEKINYMIDNYCEIKTPTLDDYE